MSNVLCQFCVLLAPSRGQLLVPLSPSPDVVTSTKSINKSQTNNSLFETKSYLSFLNQESSTTMNTKSGRAPRKLHFSSIFLSYLNTNLPRTNLDMVRIRLKPSFLIFITCSVVPCVTAVKNAISYLANIVEHPAAAWC